MSPIPTDKIAEWNEQLRNRHPVDIIRWALGHSAGRAVVSTNFRPQEAAVLHLVTQQQPNIPVLWVDHGYNRPATYRHAEDLRRRLGLNIKAYLPRVTPAHRDALHGPIPGPDDEAGLQAFSALMKLEPFQRGMRELAPSVWLTGLRHTQNAGRAGFSTVSWDANFNTLKVNPVLAWDDSRMEQYLAEHGLPNETDYFDPAKAESKRECGLHAQWGSQAVRTLEASR